MGALRQERRRALREDGPQRHRVRDDAGVRRGFELLHTSDFELDLKKAAAVWNRASVIRSWLLELAERAFVAGGTDLAHIKGYVADSGEGRRTIHEAIDRAVPMTSLAHALFARFTSRQDDSYAMKLAAALRNQFGGHAVEKE